MMERVFLEFLITGFKGAYNSSKVILDIIAACNTDKLYLENDFDLCLKQFKEKLSQKRYDIIVSFGQKPVTKSLCIETVGYDNQIELRTNYDYSSLFNFIKERNYRIKVSKNPGNYLCNHIFFHGLQFIEDNNLKTKMIFIHTPYLKNIEDIEQMGSMFTQFIDMQID